MIVNQQLSAIVERDGVNPGIRIRQGGRREFAPGLPVVRRPGLEDPPLARATERLEMPVLIAQDARLNGAHFLAIVQRFGGAPGLSQVPRALEMDLPAFVLRARRT